MKKFLKTKVTAILAIFANFAFAFFAYAVTPLQPTFVNVTDAPGLATAIGTVATAAAWFITIVSTLVILYGGFMFMTAGDDEEAVGKARKTITWAVVGIVVALLAFTVPNIVVNLLRGV